MNRREFLKLAGGGLSAGFLPVPLFGETPEGEMPLVRFGMVADIHYADRDAVDRGRRWGPADSVHYRDGLVKMKKATDVMNARMPDFMIELGDFKDDSGTVEKTLAHLDRVEAAFSEFKGPRYHALGNHDMDVLSRDEFLSHVANDGFAKALPHYSFIKKGVTFLVLDACYDSNFKPYCRNNPWQDANIPPEELAWIEKELAAAAGPVIAFCHQRLDPKARWLHDVKNAAAVRELFENSGKVKAVFTGHEHLGGVCEKNGIVYYSLRSLSIGSAAESASFAEAALYPSGKVTVTGFEKAEDFPNPNPTVKLVAHRGEEYYAPEGSRPAYEIAAKDKADFVKLDVHETKDGVIVMSHDPSLKRTMAWNVTISDVTYAEIKEKGVFKPVRGYATEKIVTLPEALAITKDAIPSFWIDFKHFTPAFCDNVFAEVRKAGIIEDRVFVATFNRKALEYMRAKRPNVRRIGHIDRGVPVDRALAYAKELDLFGVNLPVRLAPEEFDRFRKSGLWVSAWFVEDAVNAARYRLHADAYVTSNIPVCRKGLEIK